MRRLRRLRISVQKSTTKRRSDSRIVHFIPNDSALAFHYLPPHVLDIFRGMRIIAFMNQKGGVGKTTTTANLAAALAEKGQRICLIDLDPQAHLTINYGLDPTPDMVSLYNVLVDEVPLKDAIHSVGERLWLIPSSIDLAAAEVELVTVLGRETLLKNAIEASGVEYDYILMDCPPSLGLLTINALCAATEVIVPMQPHFLALQGVAKLLETVQLVNKRMNPRLKVTGVVLTMYDSQDQADQRSSQRADDVYHCRAGQSAALVECQSVQQPDSAEYQIGREPKLRADDLKI